MLVLEIKIKDLETKDKGKSLLHVSYYIKALLNSYNVWTQQWLLPKTCQFTKKKINNVHSDKTINIIYT